MLARTRSEADRGTRSALPPEPEPATPLDVARAVGNQAFMRMLAREPVAPPVEEATLDTVKLAADIMTTGKKGAKIHSLADLRDLWALAEAAIRMEPRKGKLPSTAWKQLRTPEVEPALTAMTSEERATAASEVYDALVQMLTAGSITGELVDDELERIGPMAAINVIGGKGAWPMVRTGILGAFGTIDAAHDYYEEHIVETRFFGKKVQVHHVLAAALESATTKFAALGGDPATVQLNSAGGLAIRANANNASVLSDHSFGWAIDIDGMTQAAGRGVGAGNPNVQQGALAAEGIPNFWEFVKDITGEDVFKRNAKGKPVDDSAPGAGADRLKEAQRLADLSDKLMGMFASDAALMDAMVAYVERSGIDVPQGAGIQLLSMALAAAELGPPTGGKDDPKAQREAAIAALASVLQQWFTAPRPGGAPNQGPVDPRMATRLWQMGLMFLASGNAGGTTGAVPNAEAKGTLGSIAAHGFLNLDPILVAALNSTDGGGGLRWLGATKATKDFMHFELVDHPPLTPAEAVPPVSAAAAGRSRGPSAHALDKQPMWRIGSQTPPSRMMIPWLVVCGATVVGAATGDEGVAEAADAGPESAIAATIAAHGAASARILRERTCCTTVCMGCLPSSGLMGTDRGRERRAGS
jgi:hypothetical protein